MKALLLTALIVFAGALLFQGGCAVSLSEDAPWRAWDSIEGVLRPEVRGDEFAYEVEDETIRLVTFNVEFGDQIEAIASAMEEHAELSRADVVLIQEIESYEDEGLSRTAYLAERLAMNYVYAPSKTEGQGTQGLAILSRFPLEDVETMQLPMADYRIGPQQRIALAASLAIGDERLRVIDVHLDVRLNISERIRQLHPATASHVERTAIAGDFNTNPFFWAGSVPVLPNQVVSDSDQAEMLDDYMRAMGFDTPTSESGVTQDAGIASFRLDSIYTRDLAIIDMGVAEDVEVSDHRPLWVDIAWPAS